MLDRVVCLYTVSIHALGEFSTYSQVINDGVSIYSDKNGRFKWGSCKRSKNRLRALNHWANKPWDVVRGG